jgi:hypothetical protein
LFQKAEAARQRYIEQQSRRGPDGVGLVANQSTNNPRDCAKPATSSHTDHINATSKNSSQQTPNHGQDTNPLNIDSAKICCPEGN